MTQPKRLSEIPVTFEALSPADGTPRCGDTCPEQAMATQVACAKDKFTGRVPCCDNEGCKFAAGVVAAMKAGGPPDTD